MTVHGDSLITLVRTSNKIRHMYTWHLHPRWQWYRACVG